MKYIKQLDSFRAIAVTLVIISHWLPKNHFLNILPNGDIGVDAFFVLSGFLITRILLEYRSKTDCDLNSKLIVVKNFYVRRSLRIFPVYYLLLIILLLLEKYINIQLKDSFIYHISYTSNLLFFKNQSWEGSLSHLWSLAVEEQFYLIWPWIIIFTPLRYLKYTILGFICIGICSDLILYWLFQGKILIYILTPTCFDAFGLGAIIAYTLKYEEDKYLLLKKYLKWCIVFGVCSVWIIHKLNPEIYFLRPLISLICAYLILFLIQEKSFLQNVFSNSILIFIGKISYGMYLYHNFIPWFFENLLLFIKNEMIDSILINNRIGLAVFISKYLLLVIISWMSWKLVEKPLLHYKRFFS